MTPAITPAGDAGVLVRFGAALTPEIEARVFAGLAALDGARAQQPGWLDVMPGYASLLVVLDPARTSVAEATPAIAAALGAPAAAAPRARRRVEIPVLYREDLAPDLAPLAAEKGLSVAELVARHTAGRYRCHMLGFRPGFPFLSGLDPRLVTPRLATPRARVEAGAVAIAGQQAGIYPSAGPGGWRIVGRTPLSLFAPARDPAFLIEAGDDVAFVTIDEAEFAALGGRA